ncbi:transporter [Agrilactobacillus composti DSM 18527 = JCM 14202]|nr:AAA family ATPase [Agrilactobacillus composti]GAF40032.1 transporter [Agrilactobacillus composti DSM 18527 = JCM 14202]
MFTSIEFANYKSFKHLFLDMQQSGQPKNLIAIYGENGAGKSNIVSAFMNLALSIRTYKNQIELAQLESKMGNANQDEAEIDANQTLLKMLRNKVIHSSNDDSVLSVFRSYYMINSNDPMRIIYKFRIDEHDGSYELIFKKDKGKIYLASETLKYLIKKATGTIFSINKANFSSKPTFKLSPSLFNTNVIPIFKDQIERFWGKHTFLALFYNFQSASNESYVDDNVSKNFIKVFDDLSQISIKTDRAAAMQVFKSLLHGDLYRGIVTNDERGNANLDNTELAINKYFIPLYSDILELKYKRDIIDDNRLKYDLYESKRIDGEIIKVPFVLESHGTKQLLELLPLLLNAKAGDTVVIDEIDSGIHDLLINRIVENISEDLQGQLIFTTHDTQLMREIAPSSLYVIRSDANGRKRVEPLPSIAKIKANNNVQKLYLEGYFDGIPYTDDVDFDDILDGIED